MYTNKSLNFLLKKNIIINIDKIDKKKIKKNFLDLILIFFSSSNFESEKILKKK